MNDTTRDQLWINTMQATLDSHCLIERSRHRADTIYLIVMGGRIIAMQSGFAMLEAAFVRPMNSANIMMKNMMDMFVGCLAFYLFGYQIAFNEQAVSWEEQGFDWALWFLQLSYATTAATIDSGALAGRVSFVPYVCLSFIVTGCIYPIIVRWVWGGGWLQDLGFVDFAGGSTVHLVGSVSAFVCICVCGPRVGRFPEYRGWGQKWRWIFAERNSDEYYRGPQAEIEKRVFSKVNEMHNPVQALFGVFLLLVGFLAFNPAATLSTTDNKDLLAARMSVTTLLMTAAAALTSFMVAAVRRQSSVIKIPEFATMTVAGMVCSCGCCLAVPPLLTLPIGILAALLAYGCQCLLSRHQFDDVVGAVAAHGPPGALGVLMVPLFAAPHCQNSVVGLAFGGGSEAVELLGVQIVGVVTIIVFTVSTSYVTVIALDLLLGFRSNRAAELIGHDFMEHAYEDGNISTDPNTALLIKHSPVRDSLKERVVSRHSPAKSNSADKSDGAPLPSDAAAAAPDPSAEVSALQQELTSLRHDVRRLSAMLHESQVSGDGKSGGLSPVQGQSDGL